MRCEGRWRCNRQDRDPQQGGVIMMNQADQSIPLGGREFIVRPLTLGQLRPVLDALDAVAGNSGGALIDGAVRIVHAGLAGNHPELRIDDILDLEATIDELNAAVAAILRRAGLVPVGEAGPVASPAAAGETGSAPSMAPSPPAAAMITVPSTP